MENNKKNVVEINKDNFDDEVINYKGIVLVDFYANWCGPCKMLRPILEEISESHNDVKIVSINVDEADSLAMSYGISSIPCVVKFKDGVEGNRSIGFKTKEEMEEFIGE